MTWNNNGYEEEEDEEEIFEMETNRKRIKRDGGKKQLGESIGGGVFMVGETVD